MLVKVFSVHGFVHEHSYSGAYIIIVRLFDLPGEYVHKPHTIESTICTYTRMVQKCKFWDVWRPPQKKF